MTNLHKFKAAPLSGVTRIITVCVFGLSVVLLVASFVTATTRDGASKSASYFWGSVIVALAIFICWLYSVKSYTLEGAKLTIERRLRKRTFIIEEVWEAERSGIFVGAIRVFGSGGLFGRLGFFTSPSAGVFRSYVSDTSHLIVIRTNRGLVAVSPENETEMREALKEASPLE
jgi:hypothetical protein